MPSLAIKMFYLRQEAQMFVSLWFPASQSSPICPTRIFSNRFCSVLPWQLSFSLPPLWVRETANYGGFPSSASQLVGSPLYYAQPSQVMAGVFMLSSYVVTQSTLVIPWTFTRNLQVVGFQSFPPGFVGTNAFQFRGTLHARYYLDVYT